MNTKYDEISIKPIKTGWLVEASGESFTMTDSGHKDTEYINDQYAFPTLAEAMQKITDLSTLISLTE
jgi:hypothetical protein